MVVGLLVALAACTATTRYRVLSFLFDGVPNPNAPPPAQQEQEARQTGNDLVGPARRPTAPSGSVHPPYAERRCAECHTDRKTSGLQLAFGGLRLPIEQLCVSCHEQPERRFDHAPVLLGDCVRCHHPHLSRQPALVRQPQVRDLCVACHTSETLLDPDHHVGPESRDCHECHDPHGGDQRYFLREPRGTQQASEAEERPRTDDQAPRPPSTMPLPVLHRVDGGDARR